tara:strand:- start:7 stop:639 length:633 start_codon:yes stop_codon:yes gene_type:complete
MDYDSLQKLYETRRNYSDFHNIKDKPLKEEHIWKILNAFTQPPSCQHRYEHRGFIVHNEKDKQYLYKNIATCCKDLEDYPCPESEEECDRWRKKGFQFGNINPQVLAPLVVVWYFDHKSKWDIHHTGYLDLGLGCWNSILTAQSLGIQSSFCGCFNWKYMQRYFNIPGIPFVITCYGYNNSKRSVAPFQEIHPGKVRPIPFDHMISNYKK